MLAFDCNNGTEGRRYLRRSVEDSKRQGHFRRQDIKQIALDHYNVGYVIGGAAAWLDVNVTPGHLTSLWT